MSLFDFLRDNWPLLLVPLLGLVAIYVLLPNPRRTSILLGAATGIAALLVAGFLIVRVGRFNVESFLFYVFSAAAILAGGLLITQKNPARAALSFALVVLATCGLFLLQASPFLMAATIIVYAGAIIVTFLFVIMLAQQEGLSNADSRSREPFLASMTGFLLLAALLYVLNVTYKPDLDRWVERTTAHLERVRELREEDNPSADDRKAMIADLKSFLTNYTRWLKNEWSIPRTKDEENRRRLKSPPPGGKELLGALENVRGELPLKDDSPDRVDLASFETALENLEKVGVATRNDPQLGALRPRTTAAMSELSGPASRRRVHLPPKPRDMTQEEYEKQQRERIRADEEGRPHLPAENTMYLGRSLFSDYLLGVELAGMLLLVAVIGAIAISQQAAKKSAPEDAMNPVPLHHFLVVGAVLFCLGAVGFLARRNLIVMFLSAEMMLQGVAINLVAFARYRGNLQGQAFVLFILTVAACEAAIALALILMLYKRKGALNVSLWQELREAGQEPAIDEEPLPAEPRAEPMPKLTTAGPEPEHRQETSHV